MSGATFDQVWAALERGDVAGATQLLDELRAALGAEAAPAVRSRAARAAAAAHRLAGDLAGASTLVELARSIAAEPGNDDPVVAIEAELELADLLRHVGRSTEATEAFGRAQRLADRALVPDIVRWQVALRAAGHDLTVEPAIGVARLEALVADLPPVPADALSVLPEAQQALLQALEHLGEGGDRSKALDALDDAAAAARQAEDVAAYTGARIAIAQLLEEAGDRVGAYRSLAMGWATLRAALGLDVARDAFGPMMRACRQRWGHDEFERVKAAVEDEARAGG